MTNDVDKLDSVLEYLEAGGATELLEALQKADEELRQSSNKKVVIIVTDGRPYPCDPDEVLRYAKRMKDNAIRIAAIGAGSNISEDFLKDVATPGDAYKIDNMSKLQKTFETALLAILEA